MRTVALLVAVLGSACFSPHPSPGAPCDPTLDNCPRGLACYPVGGAFRCLAGPAGDAAVADTGTDTSAIDAPMIDAPIDAAIDAMPMVLMYTATVAECIDPEEPDPAECRERNSQDLAVDADDTSTGSRWDGYVRFDIDNAPAGKTVLSVLLFMKVTSDSAADSPGSGEVWQVQPFTLASLGTTVPARIGAAPLAPDQGAVEPADLVDWPLPASIVVANTPVTLQLVTEEENGTTYHNTSNTVPPRLVVGVQ